MGAELLLPRHANALRARAGALNRRDGALRFRLGLQAGRGGGLGGDRFLRRGGLHGRDLGFLPSACESFMRDDPVGILASRSAMAFGNSVCSVTAFCSTTAGEAADASASGPGGRSVGSLRGAIMSTAISIAGAPAASSGSSLRTNARPRAPRLRREAQARRAPRKSRRAPGRIGLLKLGHVSVQVSILVASPAPAVSGTPSSATSATFR